MEVMCARTCRFCSDSAADVAQDDGYSVFRKKNTVVAAASDTQVGGGAIFHDGDSVFLNTNQNSRDNSNRLIPSYGYNIGGGNGGSNISRSRSRNSKRSRSRG